MSKLENVSEASMEPIVRRPICLCSVCGADVFIGDDLIENKVYKCGELSYISLTHRECETSIELLRYGPPAFNRMDALEDAMIESINRMSKEEIEAELIAAGIDIKPAIDKLHEMIEAKKVEQKT